MSNSPVRWLGGDIPIESHWFCHGENGAQEFYETIVATRVLLGILRNHGEDIWIAYVTLGQAVHTLTGCSRWTDGKLEVEPLYGMPNDPQALAEGLVRLWSEHAERILTLPARIITSKEA